jgi:hypothetical protein
MNISKLLSNKNLIINCCFGANTPELIELRVQLLGDVVDEFVFVNSETSRDEQQKIKFISASLPSDSEIILCRDDILMSLDCRSGNIYDWHRERLLVDSVMDKLVDEYPEDTVFIVSDFDQFIKPENVRYFANIARNAPNIIIKVPLVHLHGDAGSRVYGETETEISMFLCMRHHIKNTKASVIKYTLLHETNKEETPISPEIHALNKFSFGFVSENGVPVPDCGWKFASISKQSSRKEIKTKPYLFEDLPQVISNLPDVKKYLFGERDPNFRFSFSKKPENTLWIVDNFFENPDAVREFAIQQQYYDGGFGRGFIGRRSMQRYLHPGLKERFEQIIGMNITNWESHEMNGRFQYCYNYEPLVYHCDNQRWAAAIYLTPDAPVETGTTLWRHKDLKARSQRDPNINKCFNKGHLEKSPYEAVDVAGNIFNRLVIWDAHAIHSASQYCGETLETSRLFQVFFFD